MKSWSFSFGGISPPNEKFLLRVLGDSAVKMFSWTDMNCDMRQQEGE